MAEVYELKAESFSVGRPDIGKPSLRVFTREELERALRERTSPVIIIADKQLARPFERLLWARELTHIGTLVASLLAYAISQGYGAKFDLRVHTDGGWLVGRINGEISLTFTPPTKPAPPPADPSEE
jgi:hypothetical protein